MKISYTIGLLALTACMAGPALGTPLPAPATPALPDRAAAAVPGATLETVQYGRGWRGPAYGPPRAYYAPRPYYYGPRTYAAPVWGYRPWYRRPYYGTVVAGIALGTLIGVTAYGLAPRPPRPDLCWYWADEIESRGYWDYC